MAQLRCRVIVILFILCLSIPLAFRYQWLLAEKYAALPYLLSDMVRGDTFPDPDQRLSLAERIYLPHNGSDIFMSVLTTHKYHDKRLSRLFVTWMQTVDPKQIYLITDGEQDMWTQAFTSAGSTVVFSDCPNDKTKTCRMMCCKGGIQFDNWYRAREAGHIYNWYCHFDDDIYVNTAALIQLTRKYNSQKEYYLGNWKQFAAISFHGKDRISEVSAPGLFRFSERKRNDYRYANGPAYCISAPLMARLEKYLRGKNYVDNCNKAEVKMDDVLPGVIIEAVLGVEIIDIPEIIDQSYRVPGTDPAWYKSKTTVSSSKIHLHSSRFHGLDRVWIYHCLLYPDVSWCK